MSDLSFNASAGIDVSTAFCAHTYYAALRGLGADPTVRLQPDGSIGLHVLVGADNSEGDGTLEPWARNGDPDFSIRKEYARAAWANRDLEDEVVLVGA